MNVVGLSVMLPVLLVIASLAIALVEIAWYLVVPRIGSAKEENGRPV